MLLLLSLLAALATSPAQTTPITDKQQRAANRQALREARLADVPYKDSHLTVTPEQLERGNSSRPSGGAFQPRRRPTGSPRKPGRPR